MERSRRGGDAGAVGLGTAAGTSGGRASARDDAPTRLEDAEAASLVAGIQEGRGDLFADLYRLYFDRVYTYMRMMLRDSHEAEDATQQVFLDVLKGLSRYESRKRPFRAWLFIVARNHAIKRLRRSRREEPRPTEEIGEPNGTDEEFERNALGWITDKDMLVFIDRLPLAQRQVLTLRYMLGFSTAEISEVLERSPEAVRMQQSRALAFLRKRLTAVGRAPRRSGRAPALTLLRQARVVRLRRFGLSSPGPTG